MSRRKLFIALETDAIQKELSELSDTLEVSKAIDIVESTDQIDTVTALTEKQKEVAEQQKVVDENTQEQSVDEDQSVTDDESADNLDTEGDLSELDETVDDAVVLESLIAKFSNSAESGKLDQSKIKAIVEGISGGVAVEGVRENLYNSYALEADSVMDTVIGAIKKIWQKLVEFVSKIVTTIKTYVEAQKTKLGVAKEELIQLKENIKIILPGLEPKRTELDNAAMAQLLTTTPGKNDVAEMMSSIGHHTKMVKTYFDHFRLNFPTFVQSVNVIFDKDDDFPENVKGSLHVGKQTMPGFMAKVINIDGHKKPSPNVDVYRSAVMAKGTMVCAFISQDNQLDVGYGDRSNASLDDQVHASAVSEVTTNDVLFSRIFLAKDLEYSSDVSTLPVMNRAELNKYLDQMEHLRQAMSQAEIMLGSYLKTVSDLQKEITKRSKEAVTLTNSGKTDELRVQAQGRKVQAMALTKCLELTQHFYGNVSLNFMNFSNHVLSAAVKYCIVAIAQYTYVQKK